MDRKERLSQEIGNHFGEFFKKDNLLCIDNGSQIYEYTSHEELLRDWVDTLIEQQQSDSSINWDEEVAFIYKNVIKKKPVGIRYYASKRNGERYAVAKDFYVKDTMESYTVSLGVYSSLVKAINIRKKFDGICAINPSLTLEEAKKIAENLKVQNM